MLIPILLILSGTVLVPRQNIGSQPVVDGEGHPVVDDKDEPYTFLSYYCSNSTIPARSTCDCHCHGAEGMSCSLPSWALKELKLR